MKPGRISPPLPPIGAGLACAIALFVTPVHSALLVVPDDHATVQSALDAAVTGDSVLVRFGVYPGPFSLAGKDITLLGDEGSGSTTVLTGNRTDQVLSIGAGVTASTQVKHITFYRGYAVAEGGGVEIGGGASPVFRHCQFVENVAHALTGSSFGGAVFVGPGGAPLFEDCVFRRNGATINFLAADFGFGGAIHVETSGSLTASRCRFEDNFAAGFEGGFGGALSVSNGGSADVEDSRFTDNFAGFGGAIYARGHLAAKGNVFEGSSATFGHSAIDLVVSGNEPPPAVDPSEASRVSIPPGDRGPSAGVTAFQLVENLVFDNNVLGFGGAVGASGPGEVRGNTLAFNRSASGAAVLSVSTDVEVRNNIVAFNEGTGIGCPGLVVECNDVWENRVNGVLSNYDPACGDRTGFFGNISADPLFCDPASRRFHLRPGSPCRPQVPCGLIGALPVGCTLTGAPASGEGTIALDPPRPNPVAGSAWFSFSLPRPGRVTLDLYDAMGRRVASLADGDFSAGRHEVAWKAGDRVRPGVYSLALTVDGERRTRRLVVTR